MTKARPKRAAKAAKKATSKSANKPAKKATKKPAKKPVKKPPANKSANQPGAKTANKPTNKSAAKKPAAKKPAAKAKPAKPAVVVDEAGDFAAWVGKAMIIDIVGDAEAYFFDFHRLSDEHRAELLTHHLAAYDQRKRDEGKHDWWQAVVPIALLGESMPPKIRGLFDLSAPHEGVVLRHSESGALLYAASKDDDKLAVLAPDLESISPRESYISDVFDPSRQSYAFAVDRSESEGFTLSQIELLMQMGGMELIRV